MSIETLIMFSAWESNQITLKRKLVIERES